MRKKYKRIGEKITRGEAYDVIFNDRGSILNGNGTLIRVVGGLLSSRRNTKDCFGEVCQLSSDFYWLAVEIPEPELEMPKILSVWNHKYNNERHPVLGINIGTGDTILIAGDWETLESFYINWEAVK